MQRSTQMARHRLWRHILNLAASGNNCMSYVRRSRRRASFRMILSAGPDASRGTTSNPRRNIQLVQRYVCMYQHYQIALSRQLQCIRSACHVNDPAGSLRAGPTNPGPRPCACGYLDLQWRIAGGNDGRKRESWLTDVRREADYHLRGLAISPPKHTSSTSRARHVQTNSTLRSR